MQETKPWYKSKSMWSNICVILIPVYESLARQYSLPPAPDAFYVLLGALGIYGRATAKTAVKAKK
jgi:hypothetical protein